MNSNQTKLIDITAYPIAGLLDILLQDKTTKKNIIWATDAYASYGEGFQDKNQMFSSAFMSGRALTIRPRIEKAIEEQQERTKKKAEVFTPAWLCNQMNNYLDEDYFGRKDIFNVENTDHTWNFKKDKISIDNWQNYIKLRYLEITCGEAPFLVSRYDTSTGILILPPFNRIGLLDRKLRIISENIETEEDWLKWTTKAYQNIYGYEYQGDNLLIARINLLLTFIDYYKDKFNKEPEFKLLKSIASIISWNIWQMDGLKDTVPLGKPFVEHEQLGLDLFGDIKEETPASPCIIKDWRTNKTIIFATLKENNMSKKLFDYVIGNPPYQESDGGAGASAKPVYQFFSETAQKIAQVDCLVQPARWMTGGKGLDEYRDKMIHDTHIKVLHDYADCKEIFPNTDIKGGVCIYLRDSNYNGKCKCVRHSCDGIVSSTRPLCDGDDDVYVREPMLVNIKNKVVSKKEESLSRIVSARKPYALAAETMRNAKKFGLPEFANEPIENGYKILGLGDKGRRCWKYLPKNYPIPKVDEGLNKYKVFIAEAYGCGEIGEIPSTPVLSTPGELCTETFLQIGPFETKNEASAMLSYIKTKFLRALVGIKKQTQHTTQKVYKYVPLQDFTPNSDIDWSKSIHEIDLQLYKKYGLDDKEIEFIESHVKEMK